MRGLSDAEIAERLGVTRTRVWQLRQRAVAKLRERLAADPVIREYIVERYGVKRIGTTKPQEATT